MNDEFKTLGDWHAIHLGRGGLAVNLVAVGHAVLSSYPEPFDSDVFHEKSSRRLALVVG
jgi:hypothetical protein